VLRTGGAGQDPRAYRPCGKLEALCKGVSYYLNNLFDDDGLPKTFLQSAAPDRL
jgi:hypothetical protein